ncbi:MAG: type II secretion system protein N [Hyphomonadaceae bacterium]
MIVLRTLAVLVGLLVAGVAFMPMRFVMDVSGARKAGLTTGDISGTIWKAQLSDVAWRGTDLGDFNVAMKPAGLSRNLLRMHFSSTGMVRYGGVSLSGGALAFDSMQGRAPLSLLVRGAPSSGTLTYANGSLTLTQSGCTQAAGQVNVDGLGAYGVPPLQGLASCENGELVLSLAPTEGGPGGRIAIGLSQERSGTVTASAEDPRLSAALSMMGVPAQ